LKSKDLWNEPNNIKVFFFRRLSAIGMDLTPINRPSICFIPFIIISIASEGQATFPVTVKGGCSTAHITTISGQIQIKLADSKIEKATSLEKCFQFFFRKKTEDIVLTLWQVEAF
jgi:hypothetical protein|tara:strand:+ start:2553 stop:2897 length:345 start_codon:yes stop_codon:yes gene_type:complete